MAMFSPATQSWAARQKAKIELAKIWFILALASVTILLLVLRFDDVIGTGHLEAMALGGFVGGVELLGRYRHAPSRAMMTWSGLFYVLVNVGASCAAYGTLQAFHVFANVKDGKDLIEICAAGFGSLALMRSSIFRVKIGDSEVGIGPSAILDTLLLVADRGVDRREAVARAQDVTELVSQVKDPAVAAKMLTKYSLALMQNVDKETAQTIIDAIAKIMADTDIPDVIRMDIVALRLGVIVGPDVLEAAVSALGDRMSGVLPSVTSKQAAPAGWDVRPTAAALKQELSLRETSTPRS